MAFFKKKKVVKEKKKVTKSTNLFAMLTAEFGEEVIWDPNRPLASVETTGTDCYSVDWLLGGSGYPHGRIVEVFGAESSGKTTLAYLAMKATQKRGGAVALVDVENSIEPEYMRLCGVDAKTNFYLAQPDNAEQALSIVHRLVMTNRIDLVVLDSIGMLSPKAERDGELTDMRIGLTSRILTQHLRMMTPDLKRSKTCVIYINQIRDKIGGFGYGPQISTPGGKGMKHDASIRIEVTRLGALERGSGDNKQRIGFTTRLKTVKNKVAPPFRIVEVPILFNYGINEKLDFINLCLSSRALVKKQNFYYRGDKLIGNGWVEAWKKIQSRATLKERVLEKINTYLKKRSDLGLEVSNELDPAEAQE